MKEYHPGRPWRMSRAQAQRAHIIRFGKNSIWVYTAFYSMNMNIKMYETKMRSYRNGEEGKDLWECEKGSRVGVVGRGWSWVRKSLQPPPAVKTTPFTWQRRMTWWSRSVCRVGGRSTCWVTLRIDDVITWAGEGEYSLIIRQWLYPYQYYWCK